MAAALAVCVRPDRQVVDRVDAQKSQQSVIRSAAFASVPVVQFRALTAPADCPLHADVDVLERADDETPWMALFRWMCGRNIDEGYLIGGDYVDDLIPIVHAAASTGMRLCILAPGAVTARARADASRAAETLVGRVGPDAFRPTLPWAAPFDLPRTQPVRDVARRVL